MKRLNILFTEVGVTVLALNAMSQTPPVPPLRETSVGEILQPHQSLPPELAKLVADFEKRRLACLELQQQLQLDMTGATEARRARLREQLQESREEWVMVVKTYREDARARLEELKLRLPGRMDILESARARPGARPGLD